MTVRSGGKRLAVLLLLVCCLGCQKSREGARAAQALGGPCDLDAGPCLPRVISVAQPELVSLRGLAIGQDGATFVAGGLALPAAASRGSMPASAGAVDVLVGRYDASTARPVWLKRLGDPGLQEPSALAVTAEEMVVVAGHFTGTLEADGTKVTSPDSAGQSFLLGLSASDGRLRWAQAIDLGPGGTLASLAGAHDRVAVCGSTTRAATGLVPGAAFRGGAKDAVLAMIDGSGKRLWSLELGGEGNEECLAVAIDARGDVYAAGRYNRSFTLGAPLPEPGGGQFHHFIWVAKVDGRTGAVLAQAGFGGPAGAQLPATLAVDGQGQVVLGGLMNAALELGGEAGTLVSAGYTDGFVAKLDPASSPPFAARWAARLGGPGVDGVKSVAVDPAGNVAVAGFFTVQANGAAVLSGEPPGTDAFLLLLDGATGATRSAQSFGDLDSQTAERVAVGLGPDGRPFLALGGEFTGTVSFQGQNPLVSPGGATFLMFAR